MHFISTSASIDDERRTDSEKRGLLKRRKNGWLNIKWNGKSLFFILIFKGYEGKVVIKWVAANQMKSVTQYNIEKSSFDLDIEVRRGKCSFAKVGGGKTAES